jgi:hypothetical protein
MHVEQEVVHTQALQRRGKAACELKQALDKKLRLARVRSAHHRRTELLDKHREAHVAVGVHKEAQREKVETTHNLRSFLQRVELRVKHACKLAR